MQRLLISFGWAISLAIIVRNKAWDGRFLGLSLKEI
jgi:hypothetical protein